MQKSQTCCHSVTIRRSWRPYSQSSKTWSRARTTNHNSSFTSCKAVDSEDFGDLPDHLQSTSSLFLFEDSNIKTTHNFHTFYFFFHIAKTMLLFLLTLNRYHFRANCNAENVELFVNTLEALVETCLPIDEVEEGSNYDSLLSASSNVKLSSSLVC